MRYKLAFVLALGLAALASVPAAFAGWQETGICDVRTDFPTIQDAVNEPRCLTVRLQATREGFEFKEQVDIWRSLTLSGQSFTLKEEQDRTKIVTRLHVPDVMVGSNVLINVSGARTRVKLKYIVIEGPATGDGLIGLRAPRDTRVTVTNCVFRNMRPEPLDNRSGFVAAHVGGPLPMPKPGITGHTFTGCRFDGYQNAAIKVEGVGTTAVISDSIIAGAAAGELDKERDATTAAPVGVLVLDGAKVTINRNNLVDNSCTDNLCADGPGTAISLQGGAILSIISYNNIDRNDMGIAVEGTSRAKIFSNGLFQNGTGISLGSIAASDSNTILKNRIERGGLGLFLGQASSNVVSSNNLLTNTAQGAVLSAAAAKNTLYRNRAQDNGGLGYDDSSPATGKAKTANIYTSNICSGNNGGGAQSSPAGLCKSP